MAAKFVRNVSEFQERLMDILRDKVMKIETFGECFEDVAMSESRLLRLQERINTSVTSAFLENLSEILKEGKVEEKFEELNNLEITPGTEWKPPGDANIHMRNVRIELKERELQECLTLVNVKMDNIKKLKKIIEGFVNVMDNLTENKIETERSLVQCRKISENSMKKLNELSDVIFQASEEMEEKMKNSRY